MRWSSFLFFVLAVFLSSQLGRHFWGSWSYVWGLKVDYLSWTLYWSDLLVLAMLAMWAREVYVRGRKRLVNKQPRVFEPWFSRKSSKSLFAALLHPWTLSPQFLQSLNKAFPRLLLEGYLDVRVKQSLIPSNVGIWIKACPALLSEKLFTPMFKHGKLRVNIKSSWLKWSLVLCLMVANVLMAVRFEVAAYNMFSWLVVFGLAVYIRRNSVERWLGWGLCISLGLNLTLAVMQIFLGRSVGGGWWWLGERTFSVEGPGIAREWFWGRWWMRPYGTFSHPNALGGFGLVSLAVLDGLEIDKRLKRWGKMFGLLISILSMSQVVWAGGAIYLAARWWLRRNDGFLRRGILVFGFLILAVGGTLTMALVTREELSWRRRQVLLSSTIEVLEKRMWWGVGGGNLVAAIAPVLPKNESLFFLQPVHNGFVLMLAEWGVVGFLAGGIIAVFFLKSAIKYGRRDFLLAFLMMGWLLTWDHYVLTLQQNQLMLGVVVGFLAKKKNE